MVFPVQPSYLPSFTQYERPWTMETKLMLYILILLVHSIPSVTFTSYRSWISWNYCFLIWLDNWLPFPSSPASCCQRHISPMGGCLLWHSSGLGPILFILYINDHPDSVSFSNIAMFADDTKCFHTIKNICDANQFQQDLDSLSLGLK